MKHEREESFISIVVYVHNNEKHLQTFLETVCWGFFSNFEKYEFIFVDDSSTDNSTEILTEFVKSCAEGEYCIVHMGAFQGLESAMKAGVDLSIGDFIFEFDTVVVDYNLALVREVFDLVKNGVDIVIASRNCPGVASKAFYGLFNRFSQLSVTLSPTTFSVVSRRTINRADSMSVFIPYRKAQYAACNLDIKRILYCNDRHLEKQARQVNNKRANTAIDAIILFTGFAFRVSFFLSAVMVLFMVFSGIYVVVIYLSAAPVSGWAPIMGLLSAGFFGVFVIFSFIIKYLDLLLKTVFKRQNYLVSSIEKLKKEG